MRAAVLGQVMHPEGRDWVPGVALRYGIGTIGALEMQT